MDQMITTHKSCEACGQKLPFRLLEVGDIIRTTYEGYREPFLVKITSPEKYGAFEGKVLSTVRFNNGDVGYPENARIVIRNDKEYELIGKAV